MGRQDSVPLTPMWPSIFFSKPASYSLPLCPLVSLMKPKSPQPLCNVSPPGSDWVPLPPLGPWDTRQARLCLSTLSPQRPSSLTSHNSVSPGPWLTRPGGCHSQTSRSFPLSWLTVTLTSVTPATLLGDSEVQGDPASALALSTWPWFTAFLSTQLLSAGHTPRTVLLPFILVPHWSPSELCAHFPAYRPCECPQPLAPPSQSCIHLPKPKLS